MKCLRAICTVGLLVTGFQASPVAAQDLRDLGLTAAQTALYQVSQTSRQPAGLASAVPVKPATNFATAHWLHSASAPGPFSLVISVPKPTFMVGEAVPVQLISAAACNLVLTTAGNRPLYPASGQPVLVKANQPVMINGLTAQISQTLVATCVPVLTSRQSTNAVTATVAQINVTVQ